MTLRQLASAWNRFFFEPISPLGIALFRILLGLAVLVNCALLAPDLLNWFSEGGVVSSATAKIFAGGPRLSLFSIFSSNESVVRALFVLFIVAALCMTIGLFTRVSTIVTFLCMVSFHHRNILILNSADTFMRVALFFLMFAPAGAALSVDRLMSGNWRQKPRPQAPWAQRLIQLQLALVYLMTFFWKVQGNTWVEGTAVYYSSRLPEFWRFSVPYVFEHMWTIQLITWGTLVVEFALGTLVWIRELRYWVLLGGVLLHIGIDYSMNLPLFGPVMLFSYIVFVYPQDIDKAFAWLQTKLAARVTQHMDYNISRETRLYNRDTKQCRQPSNKI